jgi:threonine dehydratase
MDHTLVPTNSAQTFADGVACRDPQADAFAIIKTGAARVVTVSEDEIAEAIRIYYTTTHNLAEGAGAAPLAALLKERARYAGKRAGLILTGGNIDMPLLAQVLRGETPAA